MTGVTGCDSVCYFNHDWNELKFMKEAWLKYVLIILSVNIIIVPYCNFLNWEKFPSIGKKSRSRAPASAGARLFVKAGKAFCSLDFEGGLFAMLLCTLSFSHILVYELRSANDSPVIHEG